MEAINITVLAQTRNRYNISIRAQFDSLDYEITGALSNNIQNCMYLGVALYCNAIRFYTVAQQISHKRYKQYGTV